jgi:hypothetical protein
LAPGAAKVGDGAFVAGSNGTTCRGLVALGLGLGLFVAPGRGDEDAASGDQGGQDDALASQTRAQPSGDR